MALFAKLTCALLVLPASGSFMFEGTSLLSDMRISAAITAAGQTHPRRHKKAKTNLHLKHAHRRTPNGLQSEDVYAAPGSNQGSDTLYTRIAPFGREDTAQELQERASRSQDTLVDAVENAEVAEIKRSVFRSITRLRAATIKEFDTIARLETQSIDAYNDGHHYRSENPLAHLHEEEAPVETDKLQAFH
eukprot:TRINITY_DN16519_c0_g1_i1.p1 TRINITY_DN16519_c0_g1~~TRINITY_DN16519_c0_g1_i1.p1  ORF type:complete len:190 (-),score=27.30 TRINITY_DN16519_c0_g1_i1:79-648(-)